jgi:hypothetical protein
MLVNAAELNLNILFVKIYIKYYNVNQNDENAQEDE